MRMKWNYRLLTVAVAFVCLIYTADVLAHVVGAEIAKALADEIAAAVYEGNAPEREAMAMMEKVRIK